MDFAGVAAAARDPLDHIHQLQHDLGLLRHENTQLREQIKRLDSDLHAENKVSVTAVMDLSHQRQAAKELTNMMNNIAEENGDLKREKAQHKMENEELKAQIGALKREKAQHKKENEELKAQNGDLTREKAQHKKENEELKVQNGDLKRDKAQHKKEIEELKVQLMIADAQGRDVEEALRRSQAELSELKRTIEHDSERREKLSTGQSGALRDLDMANSALHHQLRSQKETLSTALMEKGAAVQRANDLQSRLEKAERDLISANNRARDAQEKAKVEEKWRQEKQKQVENMLTSERQALEAAEELSHLYKARGDYVVVLERTIDAAGLDIPSDAAEVTAQPQRKRQRKEEPQNGGSAMFDDDDDDDADDAGVPNGNEGGEDSKKHEDDAKTDDDSDDDKEGAMSNGGGGGWFAGLFGRNKNNKRARN